MSSRLFGSSLTEYLLGAASIRARAGCGHHCGRTAISCRRFSHMDFGVTSDQFSFIAASVWMSGKERHTA